MPYGRLSAANALRGWLWKAYCTVEDTELAILPSVRGALNINTLMRVELILML